MHDDTGTSTLGRVRSSIRTTAEYSRAVTIGKKVLAPARDAASHLTEYMRESYIYRWLTAEPDPEVVVIDLRETYTVGPIIELLDSLLNRSATYGRRIEPYWADSTLNRYADWSNQQLQRAAATRTGRFIRALLEPPAPPETEDRD